MSDAVLENFSAGVMENWGFDYDGLCRLRPDIVYVSMAGLGHSGPYRDYQTFGPTVQALSARTFCASKDRRSSPGAANLATVFRQACARL